MSNKLLLITLTIWIFTYSSPVLAENNPVIVVNKGIGGHATADGLKRFQRDVLDVNPDFLILYFGMNDANNPRRRVVPDVFRNNMQTMINKAKAGGIKNIILVTINPVHQETLAKRVGDHPGKTDLNKYLLQYDTIVRELAKENQLPLVDLRALCNQYGGGADVKQSLIRVNANGGLNDGVHLTQEGYQKFAQLFIPLLKGKIKPGDIVVCLGDSITYGAHMKGAGTIYGETYPAWLSVYLNQLVNESYRQKPLPPLEFSTSPKNGDMEYCADQVRPDLWSIWNVKNRQEGDFRIANKTGMTGKAMQITNSNPKYPANILSLDTPKIDPSKNYQLNFQYKGSGEIRPVILFYSKGNQFLSVFPKDVKSNPWCTAISEWNTESMAIEIPKEAIKMRASFRVTGTLLLDNVKFTKTEKNSQ